MRALPFSRVSFFAVFEGGNSCLLNIFFGVGCTYGVVKEGGTAYSMDGVQNGDILFDPTRGVIFCVLP